MTLESGYLKRVERMPQNTMQARPSMDAPDDPATPFVQAAPGVYGLKNTFESFADTVY